MLGSHGSWIEAAYGYPERARRITEEKLGQITTSITVIAVSAFAFARPGHEPAARALLDILSDSSRVAAPDNALISTAWVRAMTAAGAPCEPED